MDEAQLQGLFSEALSAARIEGRELSDEIERLRSALTRLESRKQAVDDVCRAIRRWVEVSDYDHGDSDGIEMTGLDVDTETISLSEEEVSLIAYPNGSPPNPNEND